MAWQGAPRSYLCQHGASEQPRVQASGTAASSSTLKAISPQSTHPHPHPIRSRITDLFHSVQLNVNNPHFLIMQGCITKVGRALCSVRTWHVLESVGSASLQLSGSARAPPQPPSTCANFSPACPDVSVTSASTARPTDQVLNMKPHEILSLLEEAAGTRMYEKKKDAAVKTLEKKQSRLDQIDSVRAVGVEGALAAHHPQCKPAAA